MCVTQMIQTPIEYVPFYDYWEVRRMSPLATNFGFVGRVLQQVTNIQTSIHTYLRTDRMFLPFMHAILLTREVLHEAGYL